MQRNHLIYSMVLPLVFSPSALSQADDNASVARQTVDAVTAAKWEGDFENCGSIELISAVRDGVLKSLKIYVSPSLQDAPLVDQEVQPASDPKTRVTVSITKRTPSGISFTGDRLKQVIRTVLETRAAKSVPLTSIRLLVRPSTRGRYWVDLNFTLDGRKRALTYIFLADDKLLMQPGT